MSDSSFFRQEVADLARQLIGARLLVAGVGGVIVETEAYDAVDPASHSFAGRTSRNEAMFGSPGRAYVYRIYGAHWCLNIVGGPTPGAAVLVRALEPTNGVDVMRVRRRVHDLKKLCSGPGKLCQALQITGELDKAPLDRAPFHLTPAARPVPLLCGPRIGISKATHTPWRFGLNGSPYLSRPFTRLMS